MFFFCKQIKVMGLLFISITPEKDEPNFCWGMANFTPNIDKHSQTYRHTTNHRQLNGKKLEKHLVYQCEITIKH